MLLFPRLWGGREADLTGSRALDQATGELESSCCIALRCCKCFPPRTHGLGWGLKAHPFEFTGDFLTTLRASEHEVKDSSVVRHKKSRAASLPWREHTGDI